MFTTGQVVYSKSGRDKGKLFIVYSSEVIDDIYYAYLVDGDLRKISNPKKKKAKHIQTTNYIDKEIKQKLESKSYVLDSDIRKSLSKFMNKSL